MIFFKYTEKIPDIKELFGEGFRLLGSKHA